MLVLFYCLVVAFVRDCAFLLVLLLVVRILNDLELTINVFYILLLFLAYVDVCG